MFSKQDSLNKIIGHAFVDEIGIKCKKLSDLLYPKINEGGGSIITKSSQKTLKGKIIRPVQLKLVAYENLYFVLFLTSEPSQVFRNLATKLGRVLKRLKVRV